MTVCEECGDDVETGYYFELEFPADRVDPAGRVSGTLCASCADGIATNFLVERGVSRGIPADEYEPLREEQPMMTDGGVRDDDTDETLTVTLEFEPPVTRRDLRERFEELADRLVEDGE